MKAKIQTLEDENKTLQNNFAILLHELDTIKKIRWKYEKDEISTKLEEAKTEEIEKAKISKRNEK